MQLNKLYEPADADPTGYVNDNGSGADSLFALESSGPDDGFAHLITITDTLDAADEGVMVTITGTDENGQEISEVVAAPFGNATVETNAYFASVASIATSVPFSADGNYGWSAKSVTRPIAMNWRGGVAGMQITVTGTIDYDFEQTNSDLQNSTAAAVWFIDDTAHDGATGNLVVRFDANPRFSRFKVNSLSDATISVALVQSDV